MFSTYLRTIQKHGKENFTLDCASSIECENSDKNQDCEKAILHKLTVSSMKEGDDIPLCSFKDHEMNDNSNLDDNVIESFLTKTKHMMENEVHCLVNEMNEMNESMNVEMTKKGNHNCPENLDNETFCSHCQRQSCIVSRGYYVCKYCFRAERRYIDRRIEWRNFDSETSDRARVGSSENFLFPLRQQSGGTTITKKNSESQQMYCARRYQSWKTFSYGDKRLAKLFNSLDHRAREMNLPLIVVDRSKVLLKLLSEAPGFRNYNQEGIVAASVFNSFRRENVPRTLKEVSSMFFISENKLNTGLRKITELTNNLHNLTDSLFLDEEPKKNRYILEKDSGLEKRADKSKKKATLKTQESDDVIRFHEETVKKYSNDNKNNNNDNGDDINTLEDRRNVHIDEETPRICNNNIPVVVGATSYIRRFGSRISLNKLEKFENAWKELSRNDWDLAIVVAKTIEKTQLLCHNTAPVIAGVSWIFYLLHIFLYPSEKKAKKTFSKREEGNVALLVAEAAQVSKVTLTKSYGRISSYSGYLLALYKEKKSEGNQ